MTLPNQAAGLSPIGLEFAFTNDGSIPGAVDRTQANIEAQLKARMQESTGWQTAHSIGYAGLPSAVPMNLGLLQELAQSIAGIPTGTWGAPNLNLISDVLTAIGTYSARLKSMWGEVDFLAPGTWDPDDHLPQWTEDLLLPIVESLRSWITQDDYIDASQINGYLPESLIGLIPYTAIGDFISNLLANPFLDTADALDGLTEWNWDPVIRHVARGGSAHTTGNGHLKQLRSEPITPASPGQKVLAGGWVRWSGVTAVGNAFQLAIDRYDVNNQLLGTVIVDTISDPTTNSNNLSQNHFFNLEGEYTIPAADVAHPELDTHGVTVRFIQTVNVTTGESWWHHGYLTKTQPLQKNWIQDLWDQLIVDGLFNGILGLAGQGRTPEQAQAAIEAQTNLITGTSATMMQFLAALGDGNPDADDFERPTLGTDWTVFSAIANGSLSISDGHNADWTGTQENEFVAFRNGVFAQDEFQTATVVLANAPDEVGDLIIIPTDFGYNDIWLRCTNFASWATRTGLRCRIGGDKKISLYWFLNGTGTLIFQDDLPFKAPGGGIFQFDAGIPGQPRTFRAWVNGTKVMDQSEIGTTSQFGPTYLRRGIGGAVQTSLIFVARPGKLKQFTANG